MRLRVANTDAVVGVVADSSIDLGIVEGEVSNQLLVVEDCQPDELLVLMPTTHPLVEKAAVEPNDLLNYPFLQREGGSGTRSVLARYLADAQINEEQLNQSFELGSTEAIKGAVRSGLGISVVSKVALANELQLGLVAARPLVPPLVRQYYFVRQRQPFRSHLMAELYEFARAYCETSR